MTAPRSRARARAVKRKIGETGSGASGHQEKPASDSASVVEESVRQDEDESSKTKKGKTRATTRLSETNNRTKNTDDNNHKPQQRTRKKQKMEPLQLPESEYTEIEYVNQVRQNFAPKNGLAGDLPPIHDLDEIFEQITSHAVHDDRLQKLVKSLNGRKLRVATICSGTESPILALEMIISHLKRLGFESFEFKHLFSAEIVEYKQAYIERNFHPPLLFRDAIELHKTTAHTAYGAEREVPTRPDLLVAGFPCVDYSNLNNWRKEFGERGESDDTLRALVAYCEIHRPRIAVLENISNAPWNHIGSAFEKVGYHFRSVKVDTKDFYLPQTRERGYAICIEKSHAKDGEKMLDEWASIFLSFQRRASSPFTDFIDPDDEVIEQRKLERLAISEPRSSPNWSLYKIRHADVRRETTFGNGRPITHWEEGGKCRPATWMDRPWFFSQVERVWDTIDVNHLRTLMTSGYDNSYKVRCIDISQGVDRDMDTRPLGIMGCITPCGMLYSTARGGQIQGREMLAMQGMPLSRLSLTRENQGQMQDLAGNAMSTTVVGPAIIAALISSHSLLEMGPEEKGILDAEERAEEDSPVPSLMDSYLSSPRSLTPYIKPSVNWLLKLKALAGLTVSLCSCEGPYGIGRHGLYRCMDCKFTACAACRVNPVHNYKAIPVSQLGMRKDPKMFRELLLWALPATIQPPKLPMHLYEAMSEQYLSVEETRDIWKQFIETVDLVCQDILMYKSIKRTQIWKVVYEGCHSILHLTIDPQGMHWNLFAKASRSEPARSHFREIVLHPIARMKVNDAGLSLLEGEWQICKPLSKKEKTVTLEGTGELTPSYENICGLPGAYQEQKVWSSIVVAGDDEATKGLSLDIRGIYERISNCGGALQSLHRRIPQANEPTLFFFLDPRRLGPSQLDSWVFSTDPRRKTDDMQRNIILQLDSKWGYQKLPASEAPPVLASYRQWIDAGTMSLINCDLRLGMASRIPSSNITLQIDGDSCYDCYLPLLSVATDIIPGISVPWKQGPWQAIEISNFEEIGKFAWLWAKYMTWSPSTSWRTANADFKICERCSPKTPKMAWTIIKGRERPIEDPVDAARCERDYKLRPSPFRLFTKIERPENEEEKETGHVCFGLNFKTMFHRACGTIAHRRDGSTQVDFYWRVSNNDDTDIPRPGSYRILNNNGEPEAEQPPHFKIPLRSDQRRSLQWALTRESDDMEAFPEEEVEEAVLGPLNWRAEAKVIVHRKVRGGILADHVGFGKTAVILGLIDHQHEKDVLEADEPCENRIPLKATCIVVPDILFDQWQGEISRFLGDKYIVLEIATIAKLTETSVETFQSADIVLVSWAVFTAMFYFKKLEETAGGPSPPKANSNVRMFEAWFDDVLGSIEAQVNSLQKGGPEAFLEAIQHKRNSVWGTDTYNRYLPSRRVRGKKAGMADVSDGVSSLNLAEDPEIDSSIRAGTKNGIKNDLSKSNKTGSKASNKESLFYRSSFGIPGNKQTSIGDVKGTVLHMYRFQRLVIDEFTYLNQDRHALLAALKARSRWIMSGTPPIKGFAAAEKMARLVNVYLGKASDDDYEKSKYKRSESENFHFFRDVASRGWHFRRNGLAQYFIDVFMRQNTPEIPRIQWKIHYSPIVLSAVERILYLELKLFFESYNPQTKGEKKEKYLYDQRGRVSEIVDTCDTPEQSLVKRSSYYDALPRWSSATEKIDTVPKLIGYRRGEVNTLVREIRIQSKAVSWLFHQLGRNVHRFDALKASLESNDYGDTDASNLVQGIIDEALESYHEDDWKEFWHLPNGRGVDKSTSVTDSDRRQAEKDEDSSDEEEEQQGDVDDEYVPQSRQKNSSSQRKKDGLKPLPDSASDKEKELREWTNKIRVNILALVERTRAMRFAESGHDFQNPDTAPHCQNCGRRGQRSSKDHIVLGKCGHIVCKVCLEEVLRDNKCNVHDCRAAVDKQYAIPGRYFSMCQRVEKKTGVGGTKMETLIRLLKDTNAIPEKDQVILFLQFADLEGPVTAAFEKHNISYASVGMSGGRGRSKIKAFAGNDKKVAILQLGTENAAGLNLQNANHVIFFAPFAAKNHYEYQSTITQSSGRAIRFGQKKEVHIWNLVALNTLEVGILQGQDGRTLVRHADGEYDLVLDDEIKVCDVKGFEVPAFDWK